MPTHLYCLLPAGSDSAAPSDGGSIRALEVDGIVAWVSDAPADRIPRDRKSAMREAIDHDRVIGRALARGITPMPASLADPYESDAEVRADIAERATEIREHLAKVRTSVEMALILDISAEPRIDPPPIGEGPGRAYMEGLRDLPRRAEAIASEVDARLMGFAIESSRRIEGSRIGLSHLVMRERIEAYRAAALACASERYRMLVDGPRAPYSFGAFSPARRGDRKPGGAA